MSLNSPSQDSFRPSNQQGPAATALSREDKTNPTESQETTDPITSPHGTTDEHTIPAVETHDSPAAAQNPAFQPFFTLVEDKKTGEYYHPTVHYIFSDDDTDIITAAALRSLESQQDALSSSKKEQLHNVDPDPEDEDKPALLPPPIPGVRENYLVLDVELVQPAEIVPGAETSTHPVASDTNTGPLNPNRGAGNVAPQPNFRVSAAKSFSPTWQVLQSEMVPAPTFENNEATDATGHGLMLKIHGTSGLPYVPEPNKEHGTRRLEEMMDQFAKRMAELQTIIDAVDIESGRTPGGDGGKGQDQEGEHGEKQEEEPGDGTDKITQKEETVERHATAEDE